MDCTPVIQGSFEALWQKVARDTNANSNSHPEFPLTTMTRAVFEAIAATPPPTHANTICPAIDVGTGTAIHALAMVKRGYAPVYAIDVSLDAVLYATKRVQRLFPRIRVAHSDVTAMLSDTDSPDCPQILFAVCDLDSLPTELVRQCSLMTFNPPGYYVANAPANWGPIEHGVYVDCPNLTLEDSILYRFMRLVIQAIPGGGHAICSWPGLERRVVEAIHAGSVPDGFVHPFELLRVWFDPMGVVFESDGVSDSAEAFFGRLAEVDDYGLGTSFWRNLRLGFDANWYSSLLKLSDFNARLRTTFRFGVLHLIRCASTGSKFRLVHEGATTVE